MRAEAVMDIVCRSFELLVECADEHGGIFPPCSIVFQAFSYGALSCLCGCRITDERRMLVWAEAVG